MYNMYIYFILCVIKYQLRYQYSVTTTYSLFNIRSYLTVSLGLYFFWSGFATQRRTTLCVYQ